ncbi:S9 family peptidase [Parasphingopyxis algicola]|uniref:prolyl oligopeptidase family serine peptidase n=1 Tax=Parasphingopyxis algicola TaxID=2026624 RepID=UPI0015A26EFD|nr:prolyl oligopeptidase family serine peptidase [Parasphingopyxis algicola]QLC26114.1 S9 family peptidase [Parasphingopyxis algicola]
MRQPDFAWQGKTLSALVLAVFLTCTAIAQPSEYPPSDVSGDSDVIEGVELANPFAWLEHLDSAEVAEWAAAQDEFARVSLALPMDDSAAVRARMARYDESFQINTPVRRGDHLFFLAESADRAGRSLYMYRDGADRLIAGPSDFAGIGMAEAQIDDFRVSPSGRFAAIAGVEGTSGRRAVRILDVETGEYRPDPIEGAVFGDEPWSPDGQWLYFSRSDADGEGSAWRVRLGWGEEQRLAGAGDRRYRVSYAGALGGAVIVERGASGERRAFLASADAAAAPMVLMVEAAGPLRFIGAADGHGYFYQRGRDRIVAARGARGTFDTVEIMDTSGLSVTSAHLYGDRLVINGLEAGAPAIMVYGLDGVHLHTFRPPFGLLWTNFPAGRPAILGDPQSPLAYANSIALESPGVYEIDLERLEMRPWRLRDGVEPGAVSISRRTYRSADGQEVPMVLAHRRDVDLASARGDDDAPSAPVLMWVYGAHRYTAIPFFNGFFRTFIDAGGVLAMPQIRGGGAHGARWHEAGSRANKTNTVADTVAALEWLRDEGIAGPGRVTVLGNSAGSVPAAMAGITRPDLVGALILEIPLSDLVRHARWSSGWATEFGVPDVPEEFATLRAVSPYEALQEPRPVPPTLILAGENDTVAPPHHAYKLAAAMQRAQTGDGEILLHVVRGAGHQIGVDAAQRIESQSYELAFINRIMGLQIE